jgi:hypothetical protein
LIIEVCAGVRLSILAYDPFARSVTGLCWLIGAAPLKERGGPDLLVALSRVPDPRDGQGVRHQLVTVLAAAGVRGAGRSA